MPTRKPTRAKKATTARKRAPRPNNPYGIANDEWDRLNQERQKYYEKCIAWSPEHDKILAVGETYDEIDAELGRLGIDTSTVIREFVEPYMYGIFARVS